MDSTPMLKQYFEIKKLYADALLLFRLGDFYELFDDDARTAAPVLDITLTARHKNTAHEIAMCGIPHHSSNNYIIKLVKKGYKVAICDQVSDPSLPGIVERKVTQVITPGSIDILEQNAKRDFFTSALVIDAHGFHVSTLDITSGFLRATTIRDISALLDELARIHPAEIIIDEGQFDSTEGKTIKHAVSSYFFPYTVPVTPKTFVQEHFNVQSLKGFGIEDNEGIVQSIAMLLNYIKANQQSDLTHIRPPHVYDVEEIMQLDKNALRHLDIFASEHTNLKGVSLFETINETKTPQGSRLLHQWLTYPLSSRNEIIERQTQVTFFFEDDGIRHDWRTLLGHIGDFEKIIGRIHLKKANPRHIRALTDWHKHLCNHPPVTADLENELSDTLTSLTHCIETIRKTILEDPSPLIDQGDVIDPQNFPELRILKDLSLGGKKWLSEFEREERERTGINSLKVGYNKVFGYYIEISNTNLSKVPADYIRKQTLSNAERYITETLKQRETEILTAEERALVLEKEIFQTLCEEIKIYTEAFQRLTNLTAKIDIFASFADIARNRRYVLPEIHDVEEIHILEGRHPVLEQPFLNVNFVPNDIHLTEETKTMLITGPNMGGKSTILRQVALIQIMAQVGSYVPASSAKVFPVDKIFTRIGAEDALAENASTFMVEMEETSRILHGATSKSLVLLDELGRGTSTYDGLSLAWAITEYLHDVIKPFVLFATHYHELIHLVDELESAENFHMGVAEKNNEITFLYALKPGGASQSYGIEVASLAGIPRDVITKARTILAELENGSLIEDREDQKFVRGTVRTDQLQLFSVQETELERYFRKLDIENLTPLQALNELHEIKRKLNID